MATKIFVNLPVKNLNRSIEFFTKLGYTFNPQFTDENATCMIIGENIFAMLLVEERFKDFTKKTNFWCKEEHRGLNCIGCGKQGEGG
jgi:predicted lactoylglutathione lyase